MFPTQQDNIYVVAENVLLCTSAFSLMISILMEVVLMVSTKNTSLSTKRWLRRGLMSLLIVNSLFSLASLIFFTVVQTVNSHCQMLVQQGTGHEPGHPSYGAINVDAKGDALGVWTQDSRRNFPWQLSCLAIFTFSVVLLVSAWLDLRDEESWIHGEDEENYGEKGEIYL
ncbi:hypothetical protein SCAR479_02590 [Seiridium cardinale]|uniref:Uncharacterized protein n=1 Tax=Seiridium cardinale TaxID=138064 RepID=A0ABR2Y3F0_9PEZI